MPQETRNTTLSTPAQFVPGIGPERAVHLEKLGLHTAGDLLFYFPRRYEPVAERRTIADLVAGEPATLVVHVEEAESRVSANGKSMTAVLFRDATGYVRGVWFNQPFIQQQFRRGDRLMVMGEARAKGSRWEMVHPKCRILVEGDEVESSGGLVPVYGLTEGLSQAQAQRCVQAAVKHAADLVVDVLPPALRDANQLPDILWSIQQIHTPEDEANLRLARRRFVFQEFLVQQLALLRYRAERQGKLEAPRITVDQRLDARIRRLFPFALTSGQDQVVKELLADVQSSIPMNRLLIGDVGSGKTAIAMYAILAAAAQGFQSVMMAPTEVLARQHFQTLTQLLVASRVRTTLWTGSLTGVERRERAEAIGRHEIDVIVGTSGIVYGDLDIPRLALVVIDEQHRFGVRQRSGLKLAEQAPHYLLMTATPIPRSLAMVAYGDLSVSVLREPPSGKQPVHTYLVAKDQRAGWWEFFRKQLIAGRQGFVIVPRVGRAEEEPGVDEIATLEASFETLCHGELDAFRLDLIHGGLRSEVQQTVMESFRSGATQVLVATSLVEIGLDVSNATVMVIENAERFGLAQLHQMRGRVGRGAFPGYVALFSDLLTSDAQERLTTLTTTADGFALAEIDLRLRGPGDFLGVRQHGMPTFRAARLPEDQDILQEARKGAEVLMADSTLLAAPEYAGLLRQVAVRYDERAALGDVG